MQNLILNFANSIDMSNKQNNWYIVFDGTSFFEVLKCDLDDFLSEDYEVNEITDGPFTDEFELEKKVEWYNDRFTK